MKAVQNNYPRAPLRAPASGAAGGIAREMVRTARRGVPLAIWRRADLDAPRPLVLIGHGGSGHKTAAAVERVAHALVRQCDFVVAAIDGPVHGERAVSGEGAEAVRDHFRALWAAGGSVDPMVADWTDALDDLCAMPLVDAEAIGWYGLSMGTAYGLPVVGRTPRVRCAVLGLWGDCRPHGDKILQQAAAVRVPVLFQAKPGDEIITIAGARAAFAALGSTDKRLTLHPGLHSEIGEPQLAEAVDFLQRQLKRSHMRDDAPGAAQPRHRILGAFPAPPATLVEALRACATANLADGLPQRVRVVLGLVPRHAGTGVLCGPALTVRVAAGDNLLAQHAIDLARPGDVIVIDGAAGAERALVGEVMGRWAHARGVAGFVVDGAVRDLDYLRQGPLPVYSRSVSPRGPTRMGGGEIYGEVGVGGAVVRAGDLIVGDHDGVVCVPQSVAHDAIEACLQLMARERETFEAIRRGTLSRAWIAQAMGSTRD